MDNVIRLTEAEKQAWHIHHVSRSTLFWADCFDVFPLIEDKSVDAIIADLPYGTTACKWDSILPLDKLWAEYKRILKPNGVVVLFSTQPFTTELISSNKKEFKYEWIWYKNKTTGIFNAKTQPMRNHENILVFYDNQPTYNPIMQNRTPNSHTKGEQIHLNLGIYNGSITTSKAIKKGDLCYPKTVQYFNSVHTIGKNKTEHPTQKPVELMEYLIKTYTNENEIVLDNTMGSGTTGLACLKTNRQFIGIEKEKQYYDVAVRMLSSYCG